MQLSTSLFAHFIWRVLVGSKANYLHQSGKLCTKQCCCCLLLPQSHALHRLQMRQTCLSTLIKTLDKIRSRYCYMYYSPIAIFFPRSTFRLPCKLLSTFFGNALRCTLTVAIISFSLRSKMED